MIPARALQGRRQRQAGLTLIEMLVVLAVIGVAAGATLLGLNAADRDGRAEAEAIRLARHLSLAVDEAMIMGRPYALFWDAAGYRFGQWAGAEQGWVAPASAALALRHDLPGRLALGPAPQPAAAPFILSAGGTGPAMAFDVTGTGTAWRVTFDGFSAEALPGGGS